MHLLLLCLRLLSVLYPYPLCVQAVCPPELYLRWSCVSNPLTLETLVALTHADSVEEDSTKQWLGAGMSQKMFT